MEKRILAPPKMRKALRDYSPYGDGHLGVVRAAIGHPITWLLQILFAVLVLVFFGLSAVLAGAEDLPIPQPTTIFDPSGTDVR